MTGQVQHAHQLDCPRFQGSPDVPGSRKNSMSLGFANIKDILDVLLVPLSVGLLAVLWPTLAARKRRTNFEVLIRRELEEAAPYIPDLKVADIRRTLPDPSNPNLDEGTPWHKYLT